LITQEGGIYRPYDDELESALRKCVHALKTIATEQTIAAVTNLCETWNENVKSALENYK